MNKIIVSVLLALTASCGVDDSMHCGDEGLLVNEKGQILVNDHTGGAMACDFDPSKRLPDCYWDARLACTQLELDEIDRIQNDE